MIVKCIAKSLSFLTSEDARERARLWLNAEGEYNDLDVGQEYRVQAVEYIDGGLIYYIESIQASSFPYPYLAEFFEVVDSHLPDNWVVGFSTEKGQHRFKRLAFQEWANDDRFYEILVDENSSYQSAYLSNRNS